MNSETLGINWKQAGMDEKRQFFKRLTKQDKTGLLEQERQVLHGYDLSLERLLELKNSEDKFLLTSRLNNYIQNYAMEGAHFDSYVRYDIVRQTRRTMSIKRKENKKLSTTMTKLICVSEDLEIKEMQDSIEEIACIHEQVREYIRTADFFSEHST
ncbi:hypothetical protein HHE95_00190 [Vibrio aestuarianus subsp. francensis]|uniref:hypothetical protein n=1 Tax=Vibrio aestuarianus TaxID=28171 RepID=UPI0014560DC8|nr:hypothetical protein [Vibrio aestuarianus]NLS63548.1 hypothetical protein [Vibrio aestuarianus subsp. francensis]